MSKNTNRAFGFTLIEILVVIFILAIISSVAGQVIISVLRSANKTNIINEINQNGNFVLESIEATTRNAKNAYLNNGNLVIVDQYNRKNEFWITSDLMGTYSVGVVKKAVAGGSFYTLTNSNPLTGVNVSGTDSFFSVSSSTPPVIEINLRFTQGPSTALSRIDFRYDTTFKKSLVLRQY